MRDDQLKVVIKPAGLRVQTSLTMLIIAQRLEQLHWPLRVRGLPCQAKGSDAEAEDMAGERTSRLILSLLTLAEFSA